VEPASVEDILYPTLEPHSSQRLDVGSGHRIYIEECGRANGIPLLFVHGGPGAGCSEADRRFFDPERFRVVLVDQRGAGRSLPAGETRENTTAHLVADFERVRVELGIERWHVFGGSWGSTLGLAYAQAHPERVLSLVLRGIWLFRRGDLDWWFKTLRNIHPELWREFSEHLPPDKRGDLLEGYYEILMGDDKARARAAARVWTRYEISACTLLQNPQAVADFAEGDTPWCLARLEAHYFRNQRFDPDDSLLRGVDRIRHLPAFLVHGRYDVVCPVEAADTLHRAWPGSELVIVPDAGHASRELGTARELVAACDRIADSGDPRRTSG
jgi:proline iminopeptidase